MDTKDLAQWYADFLDNIPLGVYRTTIEGKLVFCNRALAQLFGFHSTEEMIDYPVIKLYRNKRDRGALVQAVLRRGSVVDLPFSFKRLDGRDIWCAVTAKAVFDDDGMMVLLDGVMRDISREVAKKDAVTPMDEETETENGFVVLLDLQGDVLDISNAGFRFLGFQKMELLGKPFLEFIGPKDRDVFPLLLSDLVKTGREESVITITCKDGSERHLEFYAYLVKKEGKPNHIKGIAKNVTERIRTEREGLDRKKFQGVLEMAGGVAHRLNQPLMIINNLLNEVVADLEPSDRNYDKIFKVRNQIEELNRIGKKIAGIKKYESMDYVAGIKIVDIDKAS